MGEQGGDDAALIGEALAGRREAFAELVRRYERLVRALVARTVRPGRDAEADDLVQDVFLEAYRELARLRERDRFKGWLVRIALNRARGFGRRRSVEEGARPLLARAGAVAAERAGALEREEERERLLAAVRELSEEAQAVVTLRYLEGWAAPEIADALGTTPEAVRMRLSRALRSLREILVSRAKEEDRS